MYVQDQKETPLVIARGGNPTAATPSNVAIAKLYYPQVLNPTTNAIAYAYTLRHRIEAAHKKSPDQLQPGTPLWNALVLFLESFDPIQMRYAGDQWRKLVDYVELIARTANAVSLNRCHYWYSGDSCTSLAPSHRYRFDMITASAEGMSCALCILG